ncbi:MAG: (Fe-S)-binding protein [Phycisphaerae bacterium]|nr:(Fe-S)-binding protein [Phycisphaerae bacterium]
MIASSVWVANTLITLAILVVGLGVFARTILGRFGALKAMDRGVKIGHVGERIVAFLKLGIGQGRFMQTWELGAGLMHALIFWGFLAVALRTITLFGHGLAGMPHPEWHLPLFGPGALGPIYTVVYTLAEIWVLAAVLYAFYRRLVVRPKRVHLTGEALLILGLIGGLMITDFLFDATAIASHPDAWQAKYAFVGKALSGLFAQGSAATAGVQYLCFYMHLAMIVFFLNLLPLSKHFHVITALPNVFFVNMKPRGELPRMDLENEDLEVFGVNQIEHFTWKDGLDMFTCTECGRCTANCPANITGKPLNPGEIVWHLRDIMYKEQPRLIALAKAKAAGHAKAAESSAEPLPCIDDVINHEVLWSCTSCNACVEICPVTIDQMGKIMQMRRYLALMESDTALTPEMTRAMNGMENNSNPWNQGAHTRGDWAKGLDIPTMAEGPQGIEYLFFVGCAGSFDDNAKKVSVALAKILKAAGVKFAILGEEEMCTGDSARRLGNEYLFDAMAQALVEVLNGYEVKKIITACPHCYNTLKNEYPAYGGHYEVIHHTELIDRLLREGKITLTQRATNGNGEVVYHDSCYLGRYNKIYEAPRSIIARLPGARLVEADRNLHRSFCCGAGGGRMWMEETIGKLVNVERSEECMRTGAGCVAVACPFCNIMLTDGTKQAAGAPDKAPPVKDIAELVAEAAGL